MRKIKFSHEYERALEMKESGDRAVWKTSLFLEGESCLISINLSNYAMRSC